MLTIAIPSLSVEQRDTVETLNKIIIAVIIRCAQNTLCWRLKSEGAEKGNLTRQHEALCFQSQSQGK
jgi:hypothetical protein